ncbi:hypothetical protein N9L02_03135, partial [Gammaproteobacteria bacterium]|nr:hypothetical protein [Gammaproteobacteria bacterium]
FNKTNGKSKLKISKNNKNLTVLMISCLQKNKVAVQNLVKKVKIDIFARSKDNLDALIIAIKSSETEKEFLEIAKPIIKKTVDKLDRTDSLGLDKQSNTSLHLLVNKEWTKSIKFFNNSIFFDVIDSNQFDPLISSIAKGKTKSLEALLNIEVVHNSLNELLFSEDETKKDFAIKRALSMTPKNIYQEICSILLNNINRRYVIKNKLLKIINDIKKAK